MNVSAWNKTGVVFTLCAISIGLAGCMVYASVVGAEINSSVDKMLNFILGGLLGLLGRTENDSSRRAADSPPQEVTGIGGGPVPTTETPKDEVPPTP